MATAAAEKAEVSMGVGTSGEHFTRLRVRLWALGAADAVGTVGKLYFTDGAAKAMRASPP